MTEPSHISIGKIGEGIAQRYLKDLGFTVLECNYRKKWGELDIIATKDNILHFVEVKSTGRSHVREGIDQYRPEDHMHARKRESMARAISSFLHEHKVKTTYTADLIVVHVNRKTKKTHIQAIWDVEL